MADAIEVVGWAPGGGPLQVGGGFSVFTVQLSGVPEPDQRARFRRNAEAVTAKHPTVTYTLRHDSVEVRLPTTLVENARQGVESLVRSMNPASEGA